MTALAGIASRGRCWLAADSQITDAAGGVNFTAAPKCWRQGSYLLGYAGEGSIDTALMGIDWRDDAEWFQRRALREIMIALQAIGGDASEVEALIGFRGRLYYYEGSSLWPCATSFAAIGTGAAHLMGYLDAMRGRHGVSPQTMLRGAVASACRFNAHCGGRIVVVE